MMTEKELFTIWDTRQEIERLQEKIQALQCVVTSTTKIIDDLPKGTVTNSDKVGRLTAEIVDVENKIRQLEESLEVSSVALYNFFYSELDSRTATVMFLRYVGCREWREISQVMELSETRILQLHRKAKKKLLSVTA